MFFIMVTFFEQLIFFLDGLRIEISQSSMIFF